MQLPVDDLRELTEMLQEKLGPTAQELVAQLVARSWFEAASAFTVSILAFVATCLTVRACRRDASISELAPVAIAFGGCLVLVAFILGLASVGNAIAPLPQLLGK